MEQGQSAVTAPGVRAGSSIMSDSNQAKRRTTRARQVRQET
jgi:hypothetical protein